MSKVLLKGIVGDDETCFPGNLEQVLVALLNVLISAFQVVNFSTVENSDTSRSLLLSTVQNLQKLLTDENKQSFAILMESARQLNSTL